MRFNYNNSSPLISCYDPTSTTGTAVLLVPYSSIAEDTRTPLTTPSVRASANSTTPNSIDVAWDAVKNAGSYVVTATPATGSAVSRTVTADAETATYTYTIDGLAYVTEYTISVVAKPSDTSQFLDSAAGKAEPVTTGAKPSTGGEIDWSKTYTSNVTISGAKVIIGSVEYNAIQVGSSKSSGSKSFKVPANTTKLYLHVVGWNGEDGKTHTIKTSVGTISSSSIKTKADSGAKSSSPFTLSSNDYSSSDYFYEFTLTGVTSEATITISNSAGSSRGVYFGINAE